MFKNRLNGYFVPPYFNKWPCHALCPNVRSSVKPLTSGAGFSFIESESRFLFRDYSFFQSNIKFREEREKAAGAFLRGKIIGTSDIHGLPGDEVSVVKSSPPIRNGEPYIPHTIYQVPIGAYARLDRQAYLDCPLSSEYDNI